MRTNGYQFQTTRFHLTISSKLILFLTEYNSYAFFLTKKIIIIIKKKIITLSKKKREDMMRGEKENVGREGEEINF